MQCVFTYAFSGCELKLRFCKKLKKKKVNYWIEGVTEFRQTLILAKSESQRPEIGWIVGTAHRSCAEKWVTQSWRISIFLLLGGAAFLIVLLL